MLGRISFQLSLFNATYVNEDNAAVDFIAVIQAIGFVITSLIDGHAQTVGAGVFLIIALKQTENGKKIFKAVWTGGFYNMRT